MNFSDRGRFSYTAYSKCFFLFHVCSILSITPELYQLHLYFNDNFPIGTRDYYYYTELPPAKYYYENIKYRET